MGRGGWVGAVCTFWFECPLVVLACESLHVCIVCIWRCEHARFCVEVFFALYINFHSFIHSRTCSLFQRQQSFHTSDVWRLATLEKPWVSRHERSSCGDLARAPFILLPREGSGSANVSVSSSCKGWKPLELKRKLFTTRRARICYLIFTLSKDTVITYIIDFHTFCLAVAEGERAVSYTHLTLPTKIGV